MKTITKTIQVAAYTEEDGKAICGECFIRVMYNGVCPKLTWDVNYIPGPNCPVWRKHDDTGAEDDQR
jgi:hypothetical protein